MKAHKDCEIEKVVTKDATRPVLKNVYLKGEALWATDGKCMVRLPIEREEHDVDGFVSIEALKAARKVKTPEDKLSLGLNGVQSLANGAQYPRPTHEQLGNWPNCELVFDLAMKQDAKFRISFDLELLAKVASGMGCEAVTLEMEDETKPIRVLPCAKKGQNLPQVEARGVVMPICTA